MTKAVFQMGSRIFRSEFMTMRSTDSAWAAPQKASTAAKAADHRTTCRLQRRAKLSGWFMACLPSHWDNATQHEQKQPRHSTDWGRRPDPRQPPTLAHG